jgi:hypothetical protein
MWATAAVAGPLVGGSLTDLVSWRWIFYVNLPLGAVALVVLAFALPSARERVKRSIDVMGTTFLAVALASIVLLTTLGGTTFAWDSAFIIGLGVLAIVAIALFRYAEQRAEEPILPPHLFRNRVFVVTSAIGFVVGFALFGGLTFLPLFMQTVRNYSPTESGLQLLPLMAGLLTTSILSGQVITRTGRYRAWPIAGTAVLGAVFSNRLDTLKVVEDPTSAFTDALSLVFLVAAGATVVAFILAWTLPERPLRTTVGLENVFAVPEDTDSVREVTRELDRRLSREGARDFLRRVTARAELDIPPLGSYLLARAASEGSLDLDAISVAHEIDRERLRDACIALHEKDLLVDADGATGLTEAGAVAVDLLADVRYAALCEMAEDWQPEEHSELADLLHELSDDLAART